MKSFLAKEVLAHPVVLASVVVSLSIMGGSVWYYHISTTPPALVHGTLAATSTLAITAEGTVTPGQNPDLYFEASGRVAHVGVAVGQQVAAGQLLAALDTSALAAARDQAAANVALAQAKLDALTTGARGVDITAKETAVAQAEQSLANLYAQVQNDLSAAYSNALGAVHANTDSLFNSPTQNPTLAFYTTQTQAATNAANERAAINGLLASWPGELSASDPAALDQELGSSLAHLGDLRAYDNLLTQAVAGAVVDGNFTSSSVATANVNLTSLRSAISASLSALQADTEALASSKLAVQSAKDALAQLKAPATEQELEAAQAALSAAQASRNAAQAALSNATIVAPFAGTVAAVRVKVGDLASPAQSAVSLLPQSALQVEGYLSEAQAAQVAVGGDASITLDAFANARPFSATVVSVDRAPTLMQGVPAYKVVLQFAQIDASVTPGMTANLSITPR